VSSSAPLDGGQWDGHSLPPEQIRSRREAAARTRRRRLLVGDLLLGLGLCLVGLIVAPGLAVIAIAASLVLLACGLSALYGRRRGHRMQRDLQELRKARVSERESRPV
jgi:hypothetical protein